MWILWVLVFVAGVAGASVGSRYAVSDVLEVADRFGVSAGLVGVTIVAIGTDLPEIANSISVSVTGHGDLNVGDSTGSALTQVTLVLAILIFANVGALGSQRADDRGVTLVAGGVTVVATLLTIALISDGDLSRLDGVMLMTIWVMSVVGLARWRRAHDLLDPPTRSGSAASLARLFGWLGVVAVAATVLVQAFVRLADRAGVPELVASTIVLAIGTSLPELVVDWTAIRRGAATLALGDLFGSSLVDATLSIGIGPAIRSTPVSTSAMTSVAIVALGVGAATVMVARNPAAGRSLAWQLMGVYLTASGALLLFAWE